MTVTTTANSISYAGNGTTTAFAFPYIFFEPSDLVVSLWNSATQADISAPPILNGAGPYGYTVTGVVTDGEYASGGTVTFNTAPPGGYTLSIVRDVPAIQTVTLIDNTKFPAQTVNTEFDYLTVLAQQSAAMAEQANQLALHIPDKELGKVTLATPAPTRSGRVLAWDSAGNLTQSTRTLAEIEGGASPSTPLAGMVNVLSYGAMGNGTSDDTVAIQAALNTGHAVFLPKGNYLVTDMLSIPYGSGLFGETKHFSKIIVPTTFNLSALGVLRIAQEDGSQRMNEQAGTIKDVTIEFDQPETAVRANVIHYPHAIYARSAGRYVIDNIRIVRAWSGMWLDGNGAGAWINQIEASCFERTMWMDDHFDCTHIIGVHMWPFGVSDVNFPGLYSVMRDGNTIGIEIGRVDGLFMTDIFGINIPKAIWVHDSLSAGSSAAPSNGNMSQLFLDDSGMVIENGIWNVNNMNIGPGPVTARGLMVTGSPLQLALVNVTGLTQRFLSDHSSGIKEGILVGGSPNNNARLNITGMISESFHLDRIHAKCLNGAGQNARLDISNGLFERYGDITMSQPTIHIQSGRALLSGLSHTDKGTGTGTFIQIDADDWITMSNITSVGWATVVPAGALKIESDIYALRQTWTPVVTAGTGALTSYTASGRFTRYGKFLDLNIKIDIGVNGSAATNLQASLPPGFFSAAYDTITGTGATALIGITIPSGISVGIAKYDNTYPGGDGFSLRLTGRIEII